MTKDPFALSSYQFDFPEELIAQYPCTPRDHARLMVVQRSTGQITEMPFYKLIDLLNPGDQLIFNDTKVIPARLKGTRKSGGAVEVLLTQRQPDETWQALVSPAKKSPPGSLIEFGPTLSCEVLSILPDGTRHIRFHHQGDFDAILATHGKMPLPPYIKRDADDLDPESYQTIYAATPGAVAAPTAGLHFTPEMFQTLAHKGVDRTTVTLHVGLGTFRPVKTEDIKEHKMHSEHVIISSQAAEQLNRHKKSLQICVGTTSCRVLESAVNENGKIMAGEFDTDIFIYPGYHFKYVKALLTNFHVPGSTLLMLVCAFAGYDLMMEAYARAIKERYRFFSYGDAMLIL